MGPATTNPSAIGGRAWSHFGPGESGQSGATPHPPGPCGKWCAGTLGMAGRRALTKDEEQKLLALLPELSPRDRGLVTTQWMTGFRISEVLSLTYGSVLRGDPRPFAYDSSDDRAVIRRWGCLFARPAAHRRITLLNRLRPSARWARPTNRGDARALAHASGRRWHPTRQRASLKSFRPTCMPASGTARTA
jgi:hypothetical protein